MRTGGSVVTGRASTPDSLKGRRLKNRATLALQDGGRAEG